MHLIQILLPVYNKEGANFPSQLYKNIRNELTDKFGGITTYSRAPATGLWKETETKTVKDDIIIFEVMLKSLDNQWWKDYKRRLGSDFSQDEIIIRSWEIKQL